MTITRSPKFLVQSVAVCFSLLCVGHLPDLGIRGNGHEFMLQNNADRIARIYVDWLGKNVK